MKRSSFRRWLRFLTVLFILLTTGTVLAVCLLSRDRTVSMIVLAGCLGLCLLSCCLYRLSSNYITGVVAELSRLTDALTELQEQEVFPDNEDTLLSKLQSKVIKLVRILKNKNEQAEQEHENIKELVSDISHQLKTPISNLKMYSSFLRQEDLTEEKRREYVAVLCMSVERLNFLSENMIKISRLEGGLIQLKMQEQSLNETVLKAVKDIWPRAKQKENRIVYREEGQIPVKHDRNWTAEAVFNLLDNAVKYAPEGKEIILNIRRLGMFVEISVEDENGPISEEEQTKIFTRFYRGRNSRNREGVGIGLYLAREIAVRQGGYMNLRTTEKGNIFSLVLYVNAGEA